MKAIFLLTATILASASMPAAATIQDVLNAMRAGNIVEAMTLMFSPTLLDDTEQQFSNIIRDARTMGINIDPSVVQQVTAIRSFARDPIQHPLSPGAQQLVHQIRRGAVNGDQESLKLLSIMYRKGWGVKRSLAMAYALQSYVGRGDREWLSQTNEVHGDLSHLMEHGEKMEAKRHLLQMGTPSDREKLLGVSQ